MADYHAYLELDHLLRLQRPRTDDTATELAFIVIHQVSELWFKLVIDDLHGVIQGLCDHNDDVALRRFARIHEVESLLAEQLTLLDHLPPGGFAGLRPALGTASAAESQQFATIDRLSSPVRSDGVSGDPASDVWSAFCHRFLEDGDGNALVDTDEARRTRRRKLVGVYERGGGAARLCEALLDHDQALVLWRQRHALAVARQIGDRPGTGGSTGVEFLERRAARRFYPELWDARADLLAPSPVSGP